MFKASFGERLKELLIEKEIKPSVFAKKLDIDLSLVYKYFKNVCKPSLINAINIAEFFNCSLDFLLGLTETYENTNYRFNKDFSIRFKTLLKEYSISRYRLEKYLNINHQRLDDWYYGKSLPSIDRVIILADYLDCTIDYLVGWEK